MHGRARERWGEWSTEAIGNRLSPVIISHPSAVLEEHPDGLGGSHVQLTDRQKKRPDVTPVPRKYQRSLKTLAALHLLWGLAAIRTRALASCPVCQASPYPQITLILSLRRCGHTHRTPYWFFIVKTLQEDEAFGVPSGFVNTSCTRFLWGIVRLLLQNSFEIRKSSKPSKFLKQAKIRHWLDSSAHERSVLWMFWQPYKSTGGWQLSSDEYLCFEFLIHPWVCALVSNPKILKRLNSLFQGREAFLKTQS